MKVFLSYRRTDVGGYAGRLHDALVSRLGPKGVFQDVTAIAPGQQFAVMIDRALDDCDAVLAVIGPGWLTAATPAGTPRLLEPDDFVREELTRALSRNVSVVPVLVGGARLPAAEDLPPDLHDLAQRQAVVLHDETWHEDVGGLMRWLRGEPAVPTRRRRRWFIGAAVGAAALLVVSVIALWRSAGSPSDQARGIGIGSPSEGDKPACETPTGQGWNSISLTSDPTTEVRTQDGSLEFTVKEAHWRALENGQWQVILDVAMENLTSGDKQVGSEYLTVVVSQRQPVRVYCASTAQEEFVKPNRVGDARFGWQVRCKPDGFIELVVNDPHNGQASATSTISVAVASEPSDC
jgi:hypothetical protein